MTPFTYQDLELKENLPKRDLHYIELVSGEFLNFSNIEESVLTIDDIAHGLSQVCRFGAQTKEFFTVAQHSILVESIVAEAGGTLKERMQALLHDAPEAFIGDCPTPLKDLLPYYQKIEKLLAARISDLLDTDIVDLPPIVKEADKTALHIEAKKLMPAADWAEEVRFSRSIVGVSEPSGNLVSVPPFIAKDHFMSKYWSLKLKMDNDGTSHNTPTEEEDNRIAQEES